VSQTSQFEMAKAIGASSDQLLNMAGTALPSVQAQILGYVAQVNGIPPAKFTEIMTDANPDDVKQVEDEINHTARDRQSTVGVDADTSRAEEQIRGLMTRMSSAVFFLHPQSAAAPSSSAAAGAVGVTPFGVTSTGAPAATSPARLGAGMAPVVNNITVNVMVPPGTPSAEMGRYVADALDAHERRAGPRRKVI